MPQANLLYGCRGSKMFYKIKRFFLSVFTACLILTPIYASHPQTISLSTGVNAPQKAEAVPILSCDGIGNGGDHIDTTGIRFQINQNFSIIQVRLAALNPQTVNLTAELRFSSGFTGQADKTVNLPGVSLTSTVASLPYQPVQFDFGAIPISTNQTVTLKIIGSPQVYMEVNQPVNQPVISCPGTFVTLIDTSSIPPPIGSPIGFKVLAYNPASFTLNSPYRSQPPRMDGSIDLNEWGTQNSIPFDNGVIGAANDGTRLYLLVDVTGESKDNAGDSISISFDVDNDSFTSPNTDKLYHINTTTGNLRYAYYLSSTTFSPDQILTFSSRGKGFGCFTQDNTLTLSSFTALTTSCQAHRVWELAFDLNEINSAPGKTVRLGVQVTSTAPAFTNTVPTDGLSNFTNLIAVNLAPRPSPAPAQTPGSSIGLEANAVEITQAIQTRSNASSLAMGKSTAARVYAHAIGSPEPEPAAIYLFGSANGGDLPGSPLMMAFSAPGVVDRGLVNGTANFLLPESWTNTAGVTFSAGAVDQLGHQVLSPPSLVNFKQVDDPTYWVIPVNTGTQGAPTLISGDDISIQEKYLKAIYPIQDANFISKPWTTLGPQSLDSILIALNGLLTNALIAYQTTIQATSKPPFHFPDQIYGMTPSGAGQSDPVWSGGSGKIAYGYQGSSLEATFAHQVDHNMDRTLVGTWGRNVPNGCATTNSDPQWPYQNNSINEIGFSAVAWLSQPDPFLVIPAAIPDLMTHCQNEMVPTQWISPYRWDNLLNAIAPGTVQPAPVTEVYYLSGSISRDINGVISGTLDSVLRMPGSASTGTGTGNYSIVFDSQPMVTFPIQFMDDPEESIDNVYFNFQVPVSAGPDPTTIKKIILKGPLSSGSTILVEKSISANPINLAITTPKTSDSLSGMQTVIWNSTNPANISLTCTLQYSPDGINWVPVASRITSTFIAVDTSALPGSTGATARFRLIASDGFNTSQLDSGLFTLAITPPSVVIETPQPSQFIRPGQPFGLAGKAVDVQDGVLGNNNLVWTEGSTLLGVGSRITLTLPGGPHQVTLSAKNSFGKINSTTINISIANPLFFPLLIMP